MSRRSSRSSSPRPPAPPPSAWRWVLAVPLILALMLSMTAMGYPMVYLTRVLRHWHEGQAATDATLPRRAVAARAGVTELQPVRDPLRAEPALRQAFDGRAPAGWLAERGTRALLVLQHGRIVAEHYADGAQADSLQPVRQIGDAVLPMLLLAAIEDGLVQGLDDPLTRLLPELADRDLRYELYTLRHLARQQGGLRWSARAGLADDHLRSLYWPDRRAWLLRGLSLDGKPRDEHAPHAWQADLLALSLERATGRPLSDYLSQRLWQPLGMARPAAWLLDAEDGLERADSGLLARARDLARLGILMSALGVGPDGRAVLTSGAVQQLITPDGAHRLNGGTWVQLGWHARPDPQQGLLWWAEGSDGQLLLVWPRQQIVMVRLGTREGEPVPAWLDRLGGLARALAASDPCGASGTPPPAAEPHEGADAAIAQAGAPLQRVNLTVGTAEAAGPARTAAPEAGAHAGVSASATPVAGAASTAGVRPAPSPVPAWARLPLKVDPALAWGGCPAL
ncbi:MAG: hypothetical protein RIQ53_3147 [Pseudomonadota bacterium]